MRLPRAPSRFARRAAVPWPVAVPLLALSCSSPSSRSLEERVNFFPLVRYESSESNEDYATDALWPLIHSSRVGETSASRFLPFYAYSHTEPCDWLSIFLLYYQSEEATRSTRTLFPLLYVVRAPDEEKTHLWPLYGVRRYGGTDLPRRTDSFAWPLFSYDRALDGTWASLGLASLSPFFSLFTHSHREDAESGSTETEVASLFESEVHLVDHASRWRTEETDTDTDTGEFEGSSLSLGRLFFLLQPFERRTSRGEDRSDATTRILGVLDERELALGGSVTSTREGDSSTSRWFYPFYYDHSDPDGSARWFLPFYGRNQEPGGYDRSWYLPPLLSTTRDPTINLRATDLLWPLVRVASSGEGESASTEYRFLPFAWFTRRPESSIDFALPFYLRVQDADDDYLHILPFYIRRRLDQGAEQSHLVLPPLFVRTESDDQDLHRTELLWPLSRFETSTEGSLQRLFPLFYHRSTGADEHLNLLGLLDLQSEQDHSTETLYPLWSGAHTAGGGRRSSLLPLLDYRVFTTPRPSGSEFSLLFPWARFHRDDDAIHDWIFPFYWHFNDGLEEEGESLHHLWPLFGFNRDGSKTTWSTLWPFFFLADDAEREDYGELGLLYPLGYREHDVDLERNWFFPLWYHSRHDETSTSWGVWPLFYRESSSTRTLWHSLFQFLRYERDGDLEEFRFLYALYRGRTDGTKTTRSMAFLFKFEEEAGVKTLRLFHSIPIRWGERTAAGDEPRPQEEPPP